MVELARVNEEDAMRWAVATAQEADIRLEPMPRENWLTRLAPT